MYSLNFKNNNIYIDIPNFELGETLDCGQAFRWSCGENDIWSGIAKGKFLEISKSGETVILHNTSIDDFNNIWKDYFDFERNYTDIIDKISQNDVLKTASGFGNGIRILNQEPWEALCSFIISQNNNIPRIKGIIERLCQNFGEKISGGYTFPQAEKLATLTPEDLDILRSGFRAKYIIDAAKKVAGGEVALNSLIDLDIDAARNELMKILGVGPKVADCTLLFGLKHIDAFPQDVWIKRAMEVLFNGSLPEIALPFAGIAQQYIFYYARTTKLEI